MLKCHKVGARHAITSLNARNGRINVFRRKQATSKVTTKTFRRLVVKEKVSLMFCRAKDTMKSKCYVLSGHKQTNDVCLTYLECKLGQVKYGRCIIKFKW